MNSQKMIVRDKSLTDFVASEEELLAIKELQEELNTYMIIKTSMSKKRPQSTFLNLQQYLSVTRINQTEKSNIFYLLVMDAVADTKATMMAMLHKLYTEFIEGQGLQYLVLEGDAKVFDILQCLKHE